MTIHDIKHPSNSFIHRGDFVSPDDILLIDEYYRIYRNNKEIKLDFKLEWPIVRIISDDLFLLVDSQAYDQQNNAWIINNDGTIIKSFFLDEVVDIHIINSKIIASYSKCSLNTSRFITITYVNIDPSEIEELRKMKYLREEGFAVFDLSGNCLYKYMSDVKDDNYIFLMEIESVLKKDEDTVYLLAYSGSFLILELNLNTFFLKKTIELDDVKTSDYYPRSMTKKNDIWYFLTSKHQEVIEGDLNKLKSHILKLNNDLSFQKVGECIFSNLSKGIIDGSFFVPLHFGLNDQERVSCHVKIK